MNASNTQHIGNLISIVYVTDDPVFRPSRQDDFIPSYVLPLQACNGSGELRIDEIQACGTQDGGRKIVTPWVLFMEADEFLDQTNWNVLKEHCRYNNQSAARLSVQRFLPKERMKVFSWVTTSAIWQNATAEKRIYVSRETRLVPASLLGEARIASQCSGPDASFLIQIEARDETVCEAILSRELPPVAPDADPKPEDREIFRHGHQKFVDDRVYSEQFVWPHTVYHTIRYDHIFSIKEALRAGLSNPEIVAYTLIYLLRFRHFSEATEIMKMIPEHWYVRYPDLVNAAATLYFINGDPDRAIEVCRKILKIYPDSDWIAWNAIKLNILSNRYEAIDVILEDYRKATGKELDDSYLAEFRAVHGSSPKRTATVSVCMIVRNEENTLERAITSVKPFADELIVVDTGSRDNSVIIAESLGARVYHLPWSDDFSEARNFAIKQATCDYIFMLDGDEFISPFFFIESQTLLKLCPLEKPIAFAFQIGTYFNETDWLFVVQEEGNFRIENTSVRVFPRIPGIEYSGRILERIEPALNKLGIPIRIIPDKMMQLVHEHGSRRERVSRKAPIYKMLKDPGRRKSSPLSGISLFSAKPGKPRNG